MSRGSILLLLGIVAIPWSGELPAQTVSPPVKIRPQNQPSWESKSQTLFRVANARPAEIVAKQATYEFAIKGSDRKLKYPVDAFVSPDTRRLWLGPAQQFYIETDSGIIGGRIEKGGKLLWCDNMAEVKSGEKITLEDAIVTFDMECHVVKLMLALGDADNMAWCLEHITQLHEGVFRPHFFHKERGGGEAAWGADVKIVGVAIEGGDVRLDLDNASAKSTGSVWIDISSRKVTKAVDGDEQTFPKKTAGGPSK